MESLFNELKEGLEQAIEYARGTGKGKETVYLITPVKDYSCTEIRNIRKQAGMTLSTFAQYMGVSQKTVEAWESGRAHPTGPAKRLIDILERGKETELDFVAVR